MNDLDSALARFVLFAGLPWAAAVWLTRRNRWCAEAWLDRSIRVQTSLLAIVLCTQAAGAAGVLHETLPWLPPFVYVLVTRRFAKVAPERCLRETARIETLTRLLAAISLGVLLMEFARLFVPSLVGAVKVVSDAPIYHLYFAAKWWLAGAITWAPIPFGESAAPYFPANGDLWFLNLVAWTGDLTLAKVGQAPFWILAGWWVVRLCKRLGASDGVSIIGAELWMTLTPLALFTFEANVDTIFAAWFLASVLFYVEFDFRRNRESPDSAAATESPGFGTILLIHSLLAAGLAWGTKAPGLVFVPPWLAVVSFLELRRLERRTPAAVAGKLAFLWGVAVVPVAFWWIRNFVATGNPLYPLPIAAAGVTIAEGWYGPEVMRLSPYYIPFSDWRAFVDQLLAVVDPRVMPLVLFAILWWGKRLVRARTIEERWTRLLLGLGLATIALYWCLIPYRTQQRFFLHGLALFCPLLALCMDRVRGYRFLLTFVLCLHVLTPQTWPAAAPGREPPWDFSPFLPNAVPALAPAAEIVMRAAMGDMRTWGLFVFAAAGVAAFCFRGSGRPRTTAAIAAICAAGLSVSIVAERSALERLGRGLRFPVFPDYERAWNAFDAITKNSPKRVAYSGTNLAIYLMGPQFRNHVEYVNVNDKAEFMPHDYHLALPPDDRLWDDPRPTWERLTVSYDAWLKNLLDKRIDLVVVARANPNEGRANPYDRQGFPIERSWMDADPRRFRPVYGAREGDPEMRIYEVVK
jgi:hypothetical protein